MGTGETVTFVDDTETSEAPPIESNEVSAVPVAGKDRESNLPIFAITFPVDADVKSNIPLVVSTPKTWTYPFIQFWSIKKLELIVTLDPDMESDPKISVMFTVEAIFLFIFYFYISFF